MVAPFLLTRLLIPALLAAAPSRMITVSSGSAAVVNRLLHPVQLPAEAAADPLPRWRWLLGSWTAGSP